MDISYLIELITAANQETLDAYNIDLHEENLTVQSIGEAFGEESVTGGRNTQATVVANGPRVQGQHVYYYNRQQVSNIYPEELTLPLDLSVVDEMGLVDALIATGDADLDMDLLDEIRSDSTVVLKLHYNPDQEGDVDEDAYVTITGIKYYGTFNIALTLDRDVPAPFNLSELLVGDVLNGFGQNA